jgi:hypothetical protein
MKSVDLATGHPSIDEILRLAERQNLLVHTGEGKVFLVAEVGAEDTDDDFAHEVALTRQNQAVRQLLRERSAEAGKYSIARPADSARIGPTIICRAPVLAVLFRTPGSW